MDSPQEELAKRRGQYIKSTAVVDAAASEVKDAPQITNNHRYVDWLNGADLTQDSVL